jgi:glycosyltransferase involved in cell wall biosynthesis
MRILFVSNNYTPYSGGVVSSINSTVTELQKLGHDVTLVTLDFLGAYQDDPVWVRRIPAILRFQFRSNYLSVAWRPSYYLKQWILEFKPDIVHVHHPFLLGAIAVRIAQTLGIRTIFTYHTIYEAYAHNIPLLPTWITRPIIKRLVLSFCRRVDHIIAPSNGIKHYLHEHGIDNVSVIPSGLRDSFFQQSFMPKKLKKPYDLLYVGRFTKEKNIPTLLDVVAQLPDEYRCTLVGYGTYTDYLQHYAYSILKLSPEKVSFVVKPNESTLLSYYCRAHIFVFPSQTDTQGLVLAEAMACSTAVIAFDGYGQRDIICHAENGFIVHTPDEMKETIQIMFTDPLQYHMIQKKAYETSKNYASINCVKKMVEQYRKVAIG